MEMIIILVLSILIFSSHSSQYTFSASSCACKPSLDLEISTKSSAYRKAAGGELYDIKNVVIKVVFITYYFPSKTLQNIILIHPGVRDALAPAGSWSPADSVLIDIYVCNVCELIDI